MNYALFCGIISSYEHINYFKSLWKTYNCTTNKLDLAVVMKCICVLIWSWVTARLLTTFHVNNKFLMIMSFVIIRILVTPSTVRDIHVPEQISLHGICISLYHCSLQQNGHVALKKWVISWLFHITWNPFLQWYED